MRFHREPYWFKPLKVGYFALYYPVTWQGVVVTVLTVFILVHDFFCSRRSIGFYG